MESDVYKKVLQYFKYKGYQPADYQVKTWEEYFKGNSLLINAPTGSGKTVTALFADIIKNSQNYKNGQLNILWITPLRSLIKDISNNLTQNLHEAGFKFTVEDRTSDTQATSKKKQIQNLPNILVTTPESLHILFSNYGYKNLLSNLSLIVVDEWHEFINTKRGTLVQLAINNIKAFNKSLKVIGLSATIGNMEEALETLIPSTLFTKKKIINSDLKKEIIFEVANEEDLNVSKFGHTGLLFLKYVAQKIKENNSTIVFTNTRSQTELWFQKLLEVLPEFKDSIFIHHASIDKELRLAVESSLKSNSAKAVIATASLDLGVDFKGVDCIIQIGSPKGVARFVQRAGRSGRGLGKEPKIIMVPTNQIEYIDALALDYAIKTKAVESKLPLNKPIDVLCQYLITLACSYGFYKTEMFNNIKKVYSYKDLTENEFNWILEFITTGGSALKAYPQFKKVEVVDELYKVNDLKVARRHKLSIGVITEDPNITLKLVGNKVLGTIEEGFLRGLKKDQPFAFGGSVYRLIGLEGKVGIVKKAKSLIKNIPVWQGGRMPLSNEMSNSIEEVLTKFNAGENVNHLDILVKQSKVSKIPDRNNFVIETVDYRDGFYIYLYPIAGKTLHDGLASLLAYRIGKVLPSTFSIVCNDYGIELLTDKYIDIKKLIEIHNLFRVENLDEDIANSLNVSELAKRKFRNIADVSGLIFKGYPGETTKYKNLQLSTELLFNVLIEFDKDNLLLKQAFNEVLEYELNINRLKEVLKSIQRKNLVLIHLRIFSPFALPIVFEGFKQSLSTETLEDRLKRMQI